jgi:hypothetical protein
MDLKDEPAAIAQAMVAAGEIMRSNSLAGREALVGTILLVKDNAGATRSECLSSITANSSP